MNKKFRDMWEEEVVENFDLQSRHLPGVSEEKHGFRLSQDNRDLKTEPPESESETLSGWKRISLVLLLNLNSLTRGSVKTNAIKVRLEDTASQHLEVFVHTLLFQCNLAPGFKS
jgi:hypothetical protein